jgi:hypothetical protein
MTIQPIYTTTDDIDYCESDEDHGDFIYCNSCTEWVLPEEKTEFNPDTHKLTVYKICRCGDILEEII